MAAAFVSGLAIVPVIVLSLNLIAAFARVLVHNGWSSSRCWCLVWRLAGMIRSMPVRLTTIEDLSDGSRANEDATAKAGA